MAGELARWKAERQEPERKVDADQEGDRTLTSYEIGDNFFATKALQRVAIIETVSS